MEKLVCANCGEIIEDYEAFEVDGEYYCENCFDELFAYCDECGKIHYIDDMTWVDHGDRLVCDDCLDHNYIECDDCGEWVHVDDVYRTFDDSQICEDCYYDCYGVCDDCGEIYPYDMLHESCGLMYCPDCDNDIIMGYHDFDDWHNYTTGETDNGLLKGFELEVDSSWGDSVECATAIQSVVDDFCVFERDGSLSADGFEIISNPFTTNWLYKNIDMIEEMLDTIERNDYGNYGDTGLHIHVNRTQLTQGTDLSQDEVIDNILLIMETFKDEFIEFSRRDSEALNEWSQFLTSNLDVVNLGTIKAKKNNRKRYRALNLCKGRTIEFRLFNSTTDLTELVASLELVDRLVELAKDNNLDGLTWAKICDYGKYLNEYSDLDRGTVLNYIEASSEQVLFKNVELNKTYKISIYGKEYIGELLDIRYDDDDDQRLLFGIPDWNGHDGDYSTVTIPSKYEGHCWWVDYDNIRGVVC